MKYSWNLMVCGRKTVLYVNISFTMKASVFWVKLWSTYIHKYKQEQSKVTERKRTTTSTTLSVSWSFVVAEEVKMYSFTLHFFFPNIRVEYQLKCSPHNLKTQEVKYSSNFFWPTVFDTYKPLFNSTECHSTTARPLKMLPKRPHPCNLFSFYFINAMK